MLALGLVREAIAILDEGAAPRELAALLDHVAVRMESLVQESEATSH